MKVGSLFSGVGGLDLGLERTGMTITWSAEWLDYPRSVLKKHWPNITHYRDVTKVDWTKAEAVDLICGGFPCQPFSMAGHRKGIEDERWLWDYFAGIIHTIKPRYVLIENVRGLLSANDGWTFACVLSDLAELGYDAEWKIVSAASVGAPHQRDRVFIVAYPNSNGGGRCVQPLFTGGRYLADHLQLGVLSVWSETSIDRSSRAAILDSVPSICKPFLLRMADVPTYWVDRSKACGNAVVVKVAEVIGRAIMEHAKQYE